MGKSFLIFFLILAACASIGSALDCYQCSALDDPFIAAACQDPFKGSKIPSKTCGDGEVCVKQSTPETTVGSQTVPSIVATRGCADPTACENEPEQLSEHCYTCSTDLCNSAITIIPSFTTVIVLFIAKLIIL